jgi:hypothetical protein
MTPSRYLVIQCGGAWAIRCGNRTFGPFSDSVHAIDAAIDLAKKMAKPAVPRKFWCKRTEGRGGPVWAGRDPYPSTPGKPANGRAIGTYRLP